MLARAAPGRVPGPAALCPTLLHDITSPCIPFSFQTLKPGRAETLLSGGAVLCSLEPTHQGFRQHLCTSAHRLAASGRSLWVQKQHREHRCGRGPTRAVSLTAPDSTS